MAEAIFREKSLKRIASPEELGDYLHVTSPTVWMILAAVILLLAGMLFWSASTSIDSFVTGTAQVEDGTMRILFDDEQLAGSVQTGMTVRVGETESVITGIGTGANGGLFATGETTLADGSYPAQVVLRRTQILRLLFN
ncbi:MAG: hypothetical protein Q4E38_03015 [Eubacteriales bacterium]|nr:hypothetical protein [Eubacteriales bacterium]